MLKLNEKQQEIVDTIYGPVLVVACPGSGKSTSLIVRTHHMIELGISPKKILMMSFTKAAATAMEEKYKELFGCDSGVKMCTFHSLCYQIVRDFFGQAPNLITELEATNFITYEIQLKEDINNKEEMVQTFFTEMTCQKNNLIQVQNYEPKNMEKGLFDELYDKYETKKRNEQKVDFDDLLIMALNIILREPKVLNFLQSQYEYIMIDEYQDTNIVQKEIIYRIAQKNNNLMVVGDDDQSIYRFRGSKPEIMLSFPKTFRAKEIYLTTNYRSGKAIIDYSDFLIRKNQKRFEKDFIPAREVEGEVLFCDYQTKKGEISGISKKIQSLLKKGVLGSEIAILFRVNKQAIPFVKDFTKNNIPFYCRDFLENKYNHWIFKDIKAYYHLSREIGDLNEFQRVLNRPKRYLKRNIIPKNFAGYMIFDESFLIQIFRDIEKSKINKWLKDQSKNKFCLLIKELKNLSNKQPYDFLLYLRDSMKYFDYMKEYGNKRGQNISEIEDIFNEFVEETKGLTWDEWFLEIETYVKMLKDARKKNLDKSEVILSTLHSSKGLEWKYVFIVNCEEKYYPSSRATDEDDLEEELRLFYVGMTRAKDSLFLSYYSNDGKNSIYIDELLSYRKERKQKMMQQRQKTLEITEEEIFQKVLKEKGIEQKNTLDYSENSIDFSNEPSKGKELLNTKNQLLKNGFPTDFVDKILTSTL